LLVLIASSQFNQLNRRPCELANKSMPSAALDQSIQVELKILIVLLVDNSGCARLKDYIDI
jgi:hypothetical protein